MYKNIVGFVSLEYLFEYCQNVHHCVKFHLLCLICIYLLYLELTWMIEFVEIGLQVQCLFQILQKLTLKCNNFLYITE